MGASLPGHTNPSWHGDAIGYGAAHKRMGAPASNFSCVVCGKVAKDWCLIDGLLPEHVRVEVYRGRKFKYSLRIEHYEPKCRRCHLLADGGSVVAINAKKTHCPKGHPYNAENTYWEKKGRQCRACRREASRLYETHRPRGPRRGKR